MDKNGDGLKGVLVDVERWSISTVLHAVLSRYVVFSLHSLMYQISGQTLEQLAFFSYRDNILTLTQRFTHDGVSVVGPLKVGSGTISVGGTIVQNLKGSVAVTDDDLIGSLLFSYQGCLSISLHRLIPT